MSYGEGHTRLCLPSPPRSPLSRSHTPFKVLSECARSISIPFIASSPHTRLFLPCPPQCLAQASVLMARGRAGICHPPAQASGLPRRPAPGSFKPPRTQPNLARQGTRLTLTTRGHRQLFGFPTLLLVPPWRLVPVGAHHISPLSIRYAACASSSLHMQLYKRIQLSLTRSRSNPRANTVCWGCRMAASVTYPGHLAS